MEDFYFSLMEELTTMKINLAIEYVFSLSGSWETSRSLYLNTGMMEKLEQTQRKIKRSEQKQPKRVTKTKKGSTI